MRKIILFGGSFNPIHYGHVEVAKRSLKQLNADELWFIPTGKNPFKSKQNNFQHRLKMLDLVLSTYPKIKISDIEGNVGNKNNYTIDTIRKIKKMYPNDYFYFLIGDDQIPRLSQWKQINELTNKVEFVVYPREGHKHGFREIKLDSIQVSSSDIRQGKSLATSPKVIQYMTKNSLYTTEILEHKLSQSRFQHSLRVCDLALEIGSFHPQLDLKKIKVAALFHDMFKEENHKQEVIFRSKLFGEKDKAFDHAYIAADRLSRHYYYRDKQILQAIRHHVDGRAQNPYAMILYIADKCEPGREYNSRHHIELAKKDLNLAFINVKKEQKEYLRRKSFVRVNH